MSRQERSMPLLGGLLSVAAAILLLSGCQDIDTTYARRGGGASVNGINVLEQSWAERLNLRQRVAADAELGAYDLLVHIENDERRAIDNALEQHGDALDKWLRGDRQRHLVLLLHDGAMGEWLCRRWAAEAEQAAATLPAEDGERADLTEQAQRLRQRADVERKNPQPGPDAEQELPWCRVRGLAPQPCPLTGGDLGGVMPEFFRITAELKSPYGGGRARDALWSAGDQILGTELRVGSGRVTIIASTQLLLDAALVDPHARAFCERLTAHLASGTPLRAAWLSLNRGSSGEPRMNLLSLLFLTPPFNIVIIHALLALLLYVWLRAAWLGRTEPASDHRREHFGRHLDALAWRLRRARAYERCLGALAKLLGRDRPQTTTSEAEALRQAQRLYDGDERSSAPASSPLPD